MIRAAARRARRSIGCLRERWARSPVILLYHRVAVEAPDPFGLCVSPPNFAAQLEVLSSEHEPVSVAELVARVRLGQATRREVAVTFDDGYRDNLEAALPLLRRHGVPATFFIASGQSRERGFWWDALELALLRNASLPSRISVRLGSRSEAFDCTNPLRAFHRLHERLIVLPPGPRQDALRAVIEASGLAPGRDAAERVLTPSQIKAIADAPRMEIGAHSVTHSLLTRLSTAERREEIRRSRSDLEALVGRPVRGFAYPYGYFDPATIDDAREEGVEYACTCVPRRVGRREDPLRLPRIEAADCGADEFRRALAWSIPRRHLGMPS